MILVTGSNGFIGSNLCISLLNQGYKVLAIDDLSNAARNSFDRIKAGAKENWSNFTFFSCDVTELNHLLSILFNFKIKKIVHLAAVGSIQRSFSDPSHTLKVNEIGFSNILQAAHIIKAQRVVYASSSSVYGDTPYPIRHEGIESAARSPYALSKLHNEKLAKIMSKKYNLETIGLRFFNVYGPGQRHDSPYSAVISKFIHNEKLIINGDGSQIRDFTFVSDVCRAIVLALDCETHGFVANVCTGVGTSITELANKLSNGREIHYSEARPGETMTSIGSPDLAIKLLKFQTITSLDIGLKITQEA